MYLSKSARHELTRAAHGAAGIVVAAMGQGIGDDAYIQFDAELGFAALMTPLISDGPTDEMIRYARKIAVADFAAAPAVRLFDATWPLSAPLESSFPDRLVGLAINYELVPLGTPLPRWSDEGRCYRWPNGSGRKQLMETLRALYQPHSVAIVNEYAATIRELAAHALRRGAASASDVQAIVLTALDPECETQE